MKLPLFLVLMYLSTVLITITACSSSQRFEKMTTVEDVLSNYDTTNHKDDELFITKKGSVVKMDIEDIHAKMKKLEADLEEKKDIIQRRDEKIRELEKDMVELRVRLRLPTSTTVEGYFTEDGSWHKKEGGL